MKEKLIRAKAGDKNAIQEIIEAFNPLITKATLRFYIKGLEKSDIKQIATLALIKAIKNFDTEKSNSFPAYAQITVKNMFIMEMRKAENKYYKEKINCEIKEVFNIEEIKSKDIDLNEDLIKKEERMNLIKIINLLKEEDRELIKAFYIDQIKIKDYSKKHNIPYGNLIYKKNKILKYLREEYKKIS